MADGNDDEKTIKTKFGKFTLHADGSITAETDTARVEIDSDGTSKVLIDRIKRVSLDNLIDVDSYDFRSDDTATSHHIRFRGGAEFRLSYRADGKILEFRGSGGLKMSVDKEGVVTIGDADDQETTKTL
jgi:hypothetical protein